MQGSTSFVFGPFGIRGTSENLVWPARHRRTAWSVPEVHFTAEASARCSARPFPRRRGRLGAGTIRKVTQREKSGALDFQAARQIVIDTLYRLAALPAVEQVPLESAHGRVLAEPCRADRDYPSVARSLRDGFAIQAADAPGELVVTGE